MSWQALPPVRRPVPLCVDSTVDAELQWTRYFPGRSVVGYGSGTQALQAAIEDCLRRSPGRSKVVIPAYGCPDLVTACIGAGAEPVLVDVYPDRWGYDLGALDQALDKEIAAIVAVNLLGLGDQAEILRPIAEKHGARLIQDSAQSLPRTPPKWIGDYVVLSFGRGKPLNLLGGGLLAAIGTQVDSAMSVKQCRPSRVGWFCKAALFNIATDRRVLPWIYRLTGFRTGGTRYREPVSLTETPCVRQTAARCLPAYLQTSSYCISPYLPMLGRWAARGLRRLVVADSAVSSAPSEPLRLALIADDPGERDRILARLTHYGLGGTTLYQSPLPEVDGVPSGIRCQGPFPGAAQLARRVLTLPTHKQVARHPSFGELNSI